LTETINVSHWAVSFDLQRHRPSGCQTRRRNDLAMLIERAMSAALVVQYPNFFGVVDDSDVRVIASARMQSARW
jgi:glycine cleavage system pyridoxal-binding protein P